MVDIPSSDDEKKFAEALRQTADRAQQEAKYPAPRFRQMIADRGGFETARFLLSQKTPSEGFTNMHLAGRVDLTLECVVQKEQWRRFFTKEELRHAASLTGSTKC
ncbi:hypothetical protein EDD52_1067 [Primorskyibacter sedentarius]|uniref:Uncharacterized protein n=1 Tax=Primorskyibacter sedentarius TaxID=745311 RepID=A0A4R3JG94_9RHOB|nr:hypothetical protein [Primorskyibacter sedentarius]TCS63740.1 hypothetical protein EDD52_1067 [Primorskyibacter sedentarius]